MPYVVALLEYSDDLDAGPRLIGRLADPDLAETVRRRLDALRRAELRRPVAIVRDNPEPEAAA